MGVVVIRIAPYDLVRPHQLESLDRGHRNLLETRAFMLDLFQEYVELLSERKTGFGEHLLNRCRQLFGIYRFQQVIEGAVFEGFDGILDVAGSEGDCERNFAELLEQFEAIHHRHFDVEENEN